jgi:hypothetical protein
MKNTEMTTMLTIEQLIEKASKRIGTPSEISPLGIQLFYEDGWAVEQTALGEVRCYVLTTDRHYSRKRHTRAVFRLNGKVISRASLMRSLET